MSEGYQPTSGVDPSNPPRATPGEAVKYRLEKPIDVHPPMKPERFHEIGGHRYPDDLYWKCAISDLYHEVLRANAVIDQHDLCHDLHGKVNARDFADGCDSEQRKLYSVAPDADEVKRLEGVTDTLDGENRDLRATVRVLTDEGAKANAEVERMKQEVADYGAKVDRQCKAYADEIARLNKMLAGKASDADEMRRKHMQFCEETTTEIDRLKRRECGKDKEIVDLTAKLHHAKDVLNNLGRIIETFQKQP